MSRFANPLRPERSSTKQRGGFRVFACVLGLLARSEPFELCSRTNDGDRFQHFDPACGSLVMRRYQSKWTLLGN
jgi:hypothetical protein